jgi:hypothetical protein
MSRSALRTAIMAVCVWCFAASAFAQASTNGATFVGLDTSTQGNWRTNYGAEGYSLSSYSQSLPLYDSSFSVQNELNWIWAASTNDSRALQIPSGASGIAATWYNPSSFHFDVNLTDGQSHRIALYAVDWDHQGRSETIQVLDAGTNLHRRVRWGIGLAATLWCRSGRQRASHETFRLL